MRNWLLLLSGLLIWAAHFFLLYGIGEFSGTGRGARVAVGAVTAIALTGLVIVARSFMNRRVGDNMTEWMRAGGLGGIALAAISVIWQALPAVLA